MDTEDNKTQRGPVRQKLYGLHYRAIEMRYAGKKYAEICETLTIEFGRKHNESKIRGWFMRGGMLEAEYIDYCEKENARRRAEVMEQTKMIMELIPQKIKAILERTATNPFTGEKIVDKDGKPTDKLDTVTIAALKLLIDMLGFKTDPQTPDSGTDPMERWLARAKEESESQGRATLKEDAQENAE